jgi:SnoaL-like protein/aspartyl protease
MRARSLTAFLVSVNLALFSAALRAQTTASPEEIPIERCDRLPVVRGRVGTSEVRFLLDTGATTVLNIKSFSGGRIKEIHVTSWSGTAATSAREVSVPELSLGNHRLRDLKLPAIDLSPIGNACGGPIDGILGVDLLDKMAVTIDLKRPVALLGVTPADPKLTYAEMERAMGHCTTAFEHAKAEEFESCLDPEIVFYTPHEEFHGRKEVMGYLQRRFFKFGPNLHYSMDMQDVQLFGNALWYSYEYKLDTPSDHIVGHGMAMCRKSEGRWRILNMHNSVPAPGQQMERQ